MSTDEEIDAVIRKAFDDARRADEKARALGLPKPWTWQTMMEAFSEALERPVHTIGHRWR